MLDIGFDEELGWLRALSHKGGGPGFEPPGGYCCSLQSPIELVKMCVNWPGHPRMSKKKKKKETHSRFSL